MGRGRRLGLAGAMITVYPHPDHAYSQPQYDPFWAAAQDLDAVDDTAILTHVLTGAAEK